jgi:hypothetical protein
MPGDELKFKENIGHQLIKGGIDPNQKQLSVEEQKKLDELAKADNLSDKKGETNEEK